MPIPLAVRVFGQGGGAVSATRPHARQLSLICFQKRGGRSAESCYSCCTSLTLSKAVRLPNYTQSRFCLFRMIVDAPNLGILCCQSPPSCILPLRALNESNPLFVPMPIVARVSSYGASSAHARKQEHQSVSHMHDTSYAFIQQKRDSGITSSCCSC